MQVKFPEDMDNIPCENDRSWGTARSWVWSDIGESKTAGQECAEDQRKWQIHFSEYGAGILWGDLVIIIIFNYALQP